MAITVQEAGTDAPGVPPSPRQVRLVGFADPGLIGLLGFVFATVTAQLEHLGIQEASSVFWIGAAFGGIVQIIAGLLSFRIGDNFHFIVYSAFGWYWIIAPGFLFAHEVGFFDVTPGARGLFVLMFAVLSAMFVVAATTHNGVLPLTLVLVSLGLFLQGFGEVGDSSGLVLAGAWVLLGAATLAGYMLAAKFYSLCLGWKLPLGRPWMQWRPEADVLARATGRKPTTASA